MKRLLISLLTLGFSWAAGAAAPTETTIMPDDPGTVHSPAGKRGTKPVMADDPGTGGGHEVKSGRSFPFPQCFESMFMTIEKAAKRKDSIVSAAIRARVLFELDFYRKNAKEFILYVEEDRFSAISSRDLKKSFKLYIKTVPGVPYSPIIWAMTPLEHFLHYVDPTKSRAEQLKQIDCEDSRPPDYLLQAILDHIIPVSSSMILTKEDVYWLNIFSARQNMLMSFSNAILEGNYIMKYEGLTPQGVEKVLKSMPWGLQ